MAKNVKRKPDFEQVCVWPNFTASQKGAPWFEAFMLKEFGARVQYMEEIKTAPDTDPHGNPVPGTWGRNDLFFAVHYRDIPIFALPRLLAGIRWIEDALSSTNYRQKIYPPRVLRYKTWDGNPKMGEIFSGNLVLRRQPRNTENPSYNT